MTDRQLRWLATIVADVRDALGYWNEVSPADRLGWDQEWRSSLLVLASLEKQSLAGRLTPAQSRAYAAVRSDVTALGPRLRAAGLPLP